MEYRNLGRTGLKVSALCLGTMQWGWTATEEAGRQVMDAFVAAGGNVLDTADVYSAWVPNNRGGDSEEIIGRWMKERGNRRQLVVATKVRARMWEGPTGEGLTRKHIMEAVEDSLRRLQTDYIDLYQAHADDYEVPIDETMRAFDDLVRQGKVLYLGASNFAAGRLARSLGVSEARGWSRYESLQPHYNLVHRSEFERELAPLCYGMQVGVLPYSPLAAGFLTGKYRRGQALPSSDRAASVEHRYFEDDRAWDTLVAAQEIARGHGATVAQVAIAWLLAQPTVTAPIIGANTVAQLQDSLGTLDVHLTAEDLERLDVASGGPYQWND